MINQTYHFGVWNIRGLNESLKQKAASNFVRQHKLSLVGFLELQAYLVLQHHR
jgi:hypothetical protein